MLVDGRTRTITFRVLYTGPEGASKFLTLRRMQSGGAGRRQHLRVYRTEGEQVLSLESWDEHPLSGCRVRWQLLAVPGPPPSPAARRLLLRAADAVVFLPERRHPSGRASLDDLARLYAELRDLGRTPDTFPVVVLTYRDAPGEDALADVPVPPGWAPVSPLESGGDTPREVHRVFRVVRGRVLEAWRRLELEADRGTTLARLREEAAALDPGRGRRRVPVELLFYVAAAVAAAAGAWLVTSAV